MNLGAQKSKQTNPKQQQSTPPSMHLHCLPDLTAQGSDPATLSNVCSAVSEGKCQDGELEWEKMYVPSIVPDLRLIEHHRI